MAVLAPHWVATREALVDVILRDKPADLVIKGGKLVNVHTLEVYHADVAVKGGRIVNVGDVAKMMGKRTTTIDARGRYVTPGLVETHLHAYHSYVGVTEFARSMLTHGTTTYADGFYGPSIVAGVKAIKLLLEETRRTPLKVIFLVPMIGYSQNRLQHILPSPDSITADEIMEMIDWPECFGLEEPQPLPVIEREEGHMKVYRKALETGKVITGHAMGLNARQLQAYIALGTSTDHESETKEEALEKLRLGMRILARQGSGWGPNVEELVRAIYEYRIDSRGFSFDADALPPEYLSLGDIDEAIRVAVTSGIDPVTAIQMATLNAAQTFKVDHEIGSLAPGKIADIVLVEDLGNYKPEMVIANGQVVANRGRMVVGLPRIEYPKWVYGTVRPKKVLTPKDFDIRVDTKTREVEVRTIFAPVGTIVTPERRALLRVTSGIIQPSVAEDIIKIAMVDRHNSSGHIGNGFVQGLGLKSGAFGISVNTICQNLLAVGTNSEDLSVVLNEVARMGGGMVLVDAGKVVAAVELRILGLMSEETLERFLEKLGNLTRKIKEMGWKHGSPSVLEFLGCGGDVPYVKITTEGVLDVQKRKIVGVVVGRRA